ncbi:uncharacterized protein BKA55DRAFT_725638 [Fusarium redolens]|uniref:Uncharacterized protein n=1 Tax=Fusarium redolens TaxID=48865 RepID=A0A9P9HCX1_FUSRE|nr:uncharacterized protein BKA55DRAFT_725638 [Fusarium redolens]KAH7255364.1 hypothetical protein BKA55DRAFT_725638 [Fusarium redolens]
MPTAVKAPVVWINGFPGTGKKTIADAMKQLDPNILVLDNHKLIDPAAAFSREHPEYNTQRQKYRQEFLQKYVLHHSSHDHLVVFTDFQSDNELGQSVVQEYANAASYAGRPFLPVYLTCGLEANIKRVDNAERVASGTTKLLDQDLLRNLRERCELFRFQGYPSLMIDSTDKTALENAKKILDTVEGWRDAD